MIEAVGISSADSLLSIFGVGGGVELGGRSLSPIWVLQMMQHSLPRFTRAVLKQGCESRGIRWSQPTGSHVVVTPHLVSLEEGRLSTGVVGNVVTGVVLGASSGVWEVEVGNTVSEIVGLWRLQAVTRVTTVRLALQARPLLALVQDAMSVV